MKQEQPPSCPRCGYDQSGAVAAWVESCPVRGVCSECGAEFDWFRAFRHAVPPFWSYEHGAWYDVRRAAGTIVRMAWPWAFWNGLEPGVRPRVGRVLLLLVAVAFAGFGSLLTVEAFVDSPIGLHRRGLYIMQGSGVPGAATWFTGSGVVAAVLLTTLVAAVLVFPAALVHGGAARLLRAWLYSLVGVQLAWVAAALVFASAGAFDHSTAADVLSVLVSALVLVMLGWLVLWWVYAVHRQLVISHPHRWTNRAGWGGVVGAVVLLHVAWRAGLWPL